MRDLHQLDEYRQDVRNSFGWNGDGSCGTFRLPSPVDGQPMHVIASSENGWDHVSVSRSSRPPNWKEMEYIKRRFFNDDELAMQLHVPVASHINLHPNCLHLWRPNDGRAVIPLPPEWMV
jgi:hypothetical protein